MAEKGKKTVKVWTDGCFDMMHYGHANALRQARELGDYLVVGVHSDAEIARHKGPPVMDEESRYLAVEACKWVDEVVRGAPYVTDLDVMDEHGCAFCVHGDDITTDEDGNDSYQRVKDSGRYREIKRTQTVSTTDLVGRMLLCTRSHHKKLGLLSAEELASINSMSEVKRSPYTAVRSFLPTSVHLKQFSAGQREPTTEDRVVYVDGAWDLFHVGHIEFLRAAKRLGTYLVVGVLEDDVVNAYKGEGHPIMNVHERVMSVLSCRLVDEVVIGSPFALTAELLDQLRITAVAHGSEDEPVELDGVDAYKIAKDRGIFHTVHSPSDMSTTKILERIWENRKQFEKRNRAKEAKEVARIEAAEERRKKKQKN